MLEKNPSNALVHFGLANEAMKAGLLEEARRHYEAYLATHEDEGNAFGRLAEVYEKLGRREDARSLLRKGIGAANRFGHPGMAHDLEMRLEELGD